MKLAWLATSALLVFVSAVGAAGTGSIERGKALFNSTELGSNGSSCATCHPAGAGVENAGGKQTFNIMGQKLEGLEDAVNFCIKMALQGEYLKKDSQEMSDIVSYIESLNDGK